jgi:hypothetical protein
MKKILLFTFSYFFVAISVSAQKLNLNNFINSACEKNYSNVDTLYYVIGEGYPFFDSSSINTNNRIKIVYFRNEKEMIKKLPSTDDYKYLLDINISDISASLITMKIAISKTNKKLFTGERSIVVFYGEQIVECKLTKESEWVYSKTLKFKGHITD